MKPRWIFGWALIRISGHSMVPALRDGDYAIAKRLGKRRGFRIGDVVLVDHPRYGLIVKALRASVDADHVLLEGMSAASAPVDELGPISVQHVLARLVWRFAKPE